jgi:hypothetical protein
MKRKKAVRILLLGLLLISIAVGLYIYKEYNRKLPAMATERPTYTLSVLQFISDFETNETNANKKYLDKTIQVQGMVKAIELAETGTLVVVMGDTVSNAAVRCNIDSIYTDSAKQLTQGNFATIKGVCTGYNKDELLGSDVIMARCIASKENKIINKEPGK